MALSEIERISQEERFQQEEGELRISGYFSSWEEYDAVEGRIVNISESEIKTAAGPTPYFHVTLLNGKKKSMVSVPVYSDVAKELFSQLANIEDTKSSIRIEAYPDGYFTKVLVFEDGVRVPSRTLPPIKKTSKGVKIICNTIERDKAIEQIVSELNGRIAIRKSK